MGPCQVGEKWLPTSRTCQNLKWTSQRIFRCITGQHFYRCPKNYDACPGNFSYSHANSSVSASASASVSVSVVDAPSSSQLSPQCAEGYESILCGLCKRGYFQKVDDTCGKCEGGGNTAVTKTLYGLLSFSFFALLTALMVWFLRDGFFVRAQPRPRPIRVDDRGMEVEDTYWQFVFHK
jgi:hypothetical protein